MAKCKICRNQVGKNESRFYVWVKHPKKKARKVYACAHCQDAFDTWIDGHKTDDTGCLIETDRN